jgi:hypothetical protein
MLPIRVKTGRIYAAVLMAAAVAVAAECSRQRALGPRGTDHRSRERTAPLIATNSSPGHVGAR